jgi:C-terminal processing protease CtpA/Prc
MNRPTIRIVVSVLCALVALCLLSVAEGTPTSMEPSTFPSRVERLRGLAEVWGMVYYFHPALADPQKQAAWESELLIAIPEAESAETLDEYAIALQRLIAKLGDGGTSVLFPGEVDEDGEPDATRLPIQLASIDGKVVVSAIDFDAPGTASLDVGMEILSIDRVSVDEYLTEWLPVASGRTESLKQEWVFQRLLAGQPGSKVTLLVRSALDDEIPVELNRPTEEYWNQAAPTLDADMLDDGRFIHVVLPSVLCAIDRTPGIYSLYELVQRYDQLMSESDYEGVILDLRAGGKEFGSSFFVDIPLPRILAQFVGDPWTVSAGYGQRMHEGLKDPRLPMLSHPYGENWIVRQGAPFMGAAPGHDSKSLVVLVDKGSYPVVAEYLAPLEASGRAVIVGDAGTEPMRQSYTCMLPGDLGFQLRLSVPWDDEGRVSLPIVEISPCIDDLRNGRDVALDTAISILSDWENRTALSETIAPEIGALLSAFAYVSQSPLTHEERLLGLFKLWNAIRYFYPFPEMIDGEWDDVLTEFIARVNESNDEQAYYHQLQHMMGRINDGHAFLAAGYPELWKPPIEVREIEGEAVIVAIDQQADLYPALLSLEAGMIVTQVDGRSVAELIEERLLWVPGATEQHRRYLAFQQLLTGRENSAVILRVADGTSKDARKVSLTRTHRVVNVEQSPAFSWLSDQIGFIDVTRIDNAGFKQAMNDFEGADGLLVDLRGYPSSVGLGMVFDSLFDGTGNVGWSHLPLINSPNPDSRGWKFLAQRMGSGAIDAYEGEVVILTDVRAVSASEWLLLPLQDSGRAMIVGEPTAGTTSNITYVEIPGPAYAGFTGAKALHSDGSPFQGIGIIPDVEVHPTIQGIREGRDEILEKGLEVLQEMIEQRKGN